MSFKKEFPKLIFGIALFLFVFTFGFVKINTVYSSIGSSKSGDTISISTINDNAPISIYKEDYGYDVVVKFGDISKVFSIKFPWKSDNSYANK